MAAGLKRILDSLGPTNLLRGDDFDAFLRTEFMNPFVIKGGRTRTDPTSGLTIVIGGKIVGEKPPEERHSYGSFNTNGPLSDQQTRGIFQGLAHISEKTGKPTFGYLVNSHHHNAKDGNAYNLDGICRGAAISWYKENLWAQSYNLRIPVGFDHFTMPKFKLEKDYKPAENPSMGRGEARQLIIKAIDFFEGKDLKWQSDNYSGNLTFLGGADRESLKELRSRKDIIEKFIDYLTGSLYQRYRQEGKMVMKFGNFARHMFEGGDLPFILNAVASEDMFYAREQIKNEAKSILGERLQTRIEFSVEDTGEEATDYVKYNEERANAFADVCVAFHKFTGGDAYSFPIGLAHARPISAGKKLVPDIIRLNAYHRKMYEIFGRIFPFAGHAGTSLFSWASNEELKRVYKNIQDSGLAATILGAYDSKAKSSDEKSPEYKKIWKQREIMRKFFDSKGMLGSETADPDIWRGFITQVNINTNTLVENAVGALDWLLTPDTDGLYTNLYYVITRNKKVDAMPSSQIEAIRNAVIYANQKALNMYGLSPYGGGIDTTTLKRGYLVPGNATVGPGAE